VSDEFLAPGLESGEQAFAEIGRLLFHAVEAASALGVDPELALRQFAREFRADHEEDGESQ
jgi:hypothetical protein